MTSDDVLLRLHRCLVDELRRRGHPEDEPLRVADLYEEIVPYRAVRQALGVDLNADYEHALLRLLAGEAGLTRLEPAEARAELREEVEAPYPSVGRFRQFSDCDVWISMRPAPEGATAPAPGDAPPAPARAPVEPPPSRPPRDQRPRDRARGRPGRDASVARQCAYCDSALPTATAVRFCPHCGRQQRAGSCPACEAPMEAGWRYCVRCGQTVAGG